MDNATKLTDSVLLTLEVRIWCPSKKIDADDTNTMVGKTKLLIPQSAVGCISSIGSAMRTYTGAKTLPFPVRGVHRLPNGMVERYDEHMSDMKIDFDAAVDEFVYGTGYFNARRQAEEILGDLYDENDYPEADRLRSRFGAVWTYFQIGGPGDSVGVLSGGTMQKRIAEFNAMITQAEQDAVAFLRSRFTEMLSRVAGNLSDPGKKFKNSSIETFQDFLDDFALLNVAGDRDLAALVDRCKQHMSGVDPQTFRDDDMFRSQVGRQMNIVAGTVNRMFGTGLRRIVRAQS